MSTYINNFDKQNKEHDSFQKDVEKVMFYTKHQNNKNGTIEKMGELYNEYNDVHFKINNMINLKSDPNRPEITGVGFMEQIESKYKSIHNKPSVNTDEYSYSVAMSEEAMKTFNNAIKEELKSFEHIKTVEVEDDKVVKQEFHGDLGELSPDTEEEQYETLMNTFLNRKDRRKLSRYKGFKSFSDRFK